MKLSTLMIVSTCFLSKPCFSQQALNSDGSSQDQKLFANGIYMENKEILIPWKTNYEDIMKHGNPRAIAVSCKLTQIRWDSVRILNGISASLSVNHRTNVKLKKTSLHTIYAHIK